MAQSGLHCSIVPAPENDIVKSFLHKITCEECSKTHSVADAKRQAFQEKSLSSSQADTICYIELSIERQLQKDRREQFSKITKHGVHHSKSFSFTLWHAENHRRHEKLIRLEWEKRYLVGHLEARELARELREEQRRAEQRRAEEDSWELAAREFAEENGRADTDEEEEELAGVLGCLKL